MNKICTYNVCRVRYPFSQVGQYLAWISPRKEARVVDDSPRWPIPNYPPVTRRYEAAPPLSPPLRSIASSPLFPNSDTLRIGSPRCVQIKDKSSSYGGTTEHRQIAFGRDRNRGAQPLRASSTFWKLNILNFVSTIQRKIGRRPWFIAYTA